MKRLMFNLMLIVVALAGVGLLLYPQVSFILASGDHVEIVHQYDRTIEDIDEVAIANQLEAAANYNAQLRGEGVRDPFIAGSGMVMPDDYTSLLNVNGMIGYVRIPKVSVNLPIYHGTSDETLMAGAGHLEGSAFPIGGESTHSVITGHSGLASAKMFSDLESLEKGDEFYFYILNQVIAYKIDQIKVVEPDHVEDLYMVQGQDYSTLITCTPYGINSHRLLVRGVRVPFYTPEQIADKIDHTSAVAGRETFMFYVGLASVCALTVFAFIMVTFYKRRQRHAERNRYKDKIVYKRQAFYGASARGRSRRGTAGY